MASIYEQTAKDIHGKDVALSEFKGKPLLIVNTASACGFTPQYKGLEQLYQEHKEAGLVVLGFPCNQFGAQEPGSETEIQAFCERNYGVSFPLFAKVDVNGPAAHPIFAHLTGADGGSPGEIKWNFEKFLVDRSGKLKKRFSSRVKPDGDQLKQALQEVL